MQKSFVKQRILPLLLFASLTLFSFAEESALPWSHDLSQELIDDYIRPSQILDEEPSVWRDKMREICLPLIKDSKTTREATLAIAAKLAAATGVYYTPDRRKAAMNPIEALEEKKVSCTGFSILLVAALRSVDIPARAAGIACWRHVQGNHTWAEAWVDGEWRMIECNQTDFNTPWVLEAISMIDPKVRAQRIVAANPKGIMRFHPIGDIKVLVRASDETERYLSLARDYYARNGLPKDCQRLMVEEEPRRAEDRFVLLETSANNVIARAKLPKPTDDMRDFACLNLPRSKTFYVRIEGESARKAIVANDDVVYLLRLKKE